MARYSNSNVESPIASVEFTPVADGNFTFVYVKPRKDTEAIKTWLTSPAIGQEIVATTLVEGQTAFVTHGDKSKEDMMNALEAHGEKLALEQSEGKFNAWKWRGTLSNIGQTLNIFSGLRKPGGLDTPKIMFAGLNFAASYVNSTFGGQKREDEYQLHYLKKHINDLLGKHLPAGQEPLDVHDSRADIRHEPEQPKTYGQKFHDFMAANSVRLGEIGLRFFGSIALAFPMKNWGAAYQELRKGSLAGAFNTARNKDSTNFKTGITYLTGKTIGLFSKIPDPYNPKPATLIDTIREKYLFRLSSTIESGAAATLAYGNFKKDKNGKRDYIGAAGGAVLTSGLLIRLFAPFGTRAVDMEELYAHTTDLLANTPPEKLPQLIADSAAALKEHFKDKAPNYSAIYTRMMSELYRYHHIALDNLGTEPEERLAKMQAEIQTPAAIPEAATNRFALEHASRPTENLIVPAASHAEAVAKAKDAAEPQLGMAV